MAETIPVDTTNVDTTNKGGRAALLGAMFLMATGAISSGFITQTTEFTVQLGAAGIHLFGIILWAASITSVIGAAYTSVSFLTKSDTVPRTRNLLTVAFIAISTISYLLIKTTPVRLLTFAGAFNGIILPFGFTIILWVAWRRRDLLGGYRYPAWLLGIGVIAWLITLYLGYESLTTRGDL